MTAATAFTYESQLTEQQKSLLIAAGVRIAPTWPLDQMIAVNPFWEMRDEPIERVAARLSTLTGARLLMPKEYYLGLYKSGDISRASLLQAATEQKVT